MTSMGRIVSGVDGRALLRFLADVRGSTKPSVVECARFGDGGKSSGRAIKEL